jgi:hypothetical protein
MQTNRLLPVAVAWLFVLLPSVANAQSSAAGQDERRGLLSEPRLLTRGITWIEDFGKDEDDEPSDGFYPEFGQMITGAGWLSAGPGYRLHLFNRQAIVEASAAISLRAYKIAQARIEFPHLANDRIVVGSKALWHDYTQVRYYGVGPDVTEDEVSDYRVKALAAVAYGEYKLTDAVSFHAAVGSLSRPEFSSSTGPGDREYPDTLTVHRGDPAVGLEPQPQWMHTDFALVYDTRNHVDYPSNGAVYRLAWTDYRDLGGPGTFDFGRVQAEAAQFVPMAGGRSVLALRIWGVASDTADRHDVPFYFLPSIGGGSTLRAYREYRFHDRHFVVVNVESRWALFDHVDVAGFFDAGNVAGSIDDLNFDKKSFGAGLRVHTRSATLGRVDVAYGDEGWRLVLKTSDPLRMKHLTRLTAALPFVP